MLFVLEPRVSLEATSLSLQGLSTSHPTQTQVAWLFMGFTGYGCCCCINVLLS
ncbi:hypothetical protein Hanom_Chr16g01522531 [Helianthus anomalus]